MNHCILNHENIKMTFSSSLIGIAFSILLFTFHPGTCQSANRPGAGTVGCYDRAAPVIRINSRKVDATKRENIQRRAVSAASGLYRNGS